MALSLAKTQQLICRSLGITPDQLLAAFAPASTADLPALVAFRQAYLGTAIAWDDLGYLRWRYNFAKGAAVPGQQLSLPQDATTNRLWVLRLNGEILGILGLDHVQLRRSGQTLNAKNPLDLLVKAECNGLGLGVWMTQALQAEYPLMFAMGATRHSLGIITKLFQPMLDLGSWKLLLHAGDFIARRLGPSPWVKRLAWPIDAALGIYRHWRLRGTPHNYNLAPIADFSSLAEQLAALQSTWDASGQILRLRTPEFLNWRFLCNPRRAYSALGAWHEGIFKGYAVYHYKAQQSLQIDDLFVAPEDGESLRYLLRQLITLAEQASVKTLIFTTLPQVYAAQFHAMGFSWRDDGHAFSVLAPAADQAVFYCSDRWMVTHADTHSEGF